MSDAGKTGDGDAGQQGAGDQGKGGDAGQQGKGGDTQKAIDAVVARERARADKALSELRSTFETQIAELQGQLESQKGGDGKGGKKATEPDEFKDAVARARKPVEDALEAERAKLKALHRQIARADILAAAAPNSVDAEAVADLLEHRVRVTEAGGREVVGKDGNPEYGANGPKQVAELVAELLEAKPYLAKSKAKDGVDFQQGARSTTGKTKDELKQQIAALEAQGKFDDAAPLKSELIKLAK